MRRRIVLLGATGYTGRLVAEALVQARARPVLAGRSSQNLSALGAELGKGLDPVGASAVAPHFAWRGGELVEVPAGDQVRTFAVNGSERPALAIGGLEHLTLPRLRPSLRDVNVYLGAARSEREARTAAKVAAMA